MGNRPRKLQAKLKNLLTSSRFRLRRMWNQLKRPKAGGWVKQALKWVAVSLIGIIFAAAVSQTGLLEILFPKKCLTNGTLNVGIATFSTGEGVSQADARDFSELFYTQFAAQLEALDAELESADIEMCGPDTLRTIDGRTLEDRAEAATRRANDLQLDFLIYGTVERRSDTFLEFNPEFFVQSVDIEDTIGGAFAFGAPITFSSNRADQTLANEELERRSSAILLATRGLTLHYIGNYEGAMQYFELANDEALWPSSRNREVLYILLGNAATRAGHFDEAEAAYNDALDLNPEYSRGYLGKGNVTYLEALESSECNLFTADQVLLREAQEFYEQAMHASVQPPTADLPSKVAYGTGQIYLVQWLVGKDPIDLEEAVHSFESVIDNYGSGENPRLRELASESHNLLGLAAQEGGDLDAAIHHYEDALNLSEDPARRAFIEAQLSRFYRGSDVAQADIHAQAAIDEYLRAQIRTSQPQQDALYWRQIARLYQDLGQRQDAVVAMRDAIRLLPEDDKCFAFFNEYYDSLLAGN